MRRMFVAAAAAGLMFAAGCQDQEARQRNLELKAELDALKAKQEDQKTDPVLAALLSGKGTTNNEALERKVNALSEDLKAGLDALKTEVRNSGKDTETRYEDLETRLKKLSDLETTIASLKTSLDTLDSKVKSSDPQELLKLQRDLLTREHTLGIEKAAREAAEAKAATLEADIAATRQEVEDLKAQVTGLSGDDISKHPQYKKLQGELREARSELEKLKSDFKNLDDQYKALVEQIGKGTKPEPDRAPKLDRSKYDFTGEVATVAGGARPGAPSNLILTIKTGQVPPVGAEMMVLDARNEVVCKVRVIRHYHVSDNADLPVNELGCSTLDEKTTRPVAKGDSVVWIKPAEDSETQPSGGGGGTAGGN